MNSRRLLVTLGVLAAVAIVSVAGWRLWRARRAPAPVAVVDSTQAGVRAMTLWFADDSGDSLVSETREMLEVDDLHGRTDALVGALVQGPARRGRAVLPPGTTVLHAYLDGSGLLTLDLSRAFQQGFRGGSRAEELAVGSLVRTLGANVPEVQRVLLVCNGAPLASLAGHVPLDQPLVVSDWP